ncbi:GNAT family N-acetyltransferase [Thalassotalea mangrovi]|uniref:GNAT family N-acetyltransferase n=1 Tax=Thalassotalea mangrovi TaxID=2572245 RepID=A0A4U1B6X2_9GAMM|nr:GNAT family N-acetyltransferase [Thalassotalea mangrovi]TKB45665.1 GNAT family N-acetyltransferase [Thalassotalea mangrovi]
MSVEVIVADYKNPQHCKDLIFLLNAYAEDPMGGNEPLTDYVRENLCEKLAEQTNTLTLLAYVDNKPAAICNCVFGFSTFKAKPLLNIHDIAVLPEFRGQKLSHQLLTRAESIAKQKGCCKLTLEVLQGNQVARQSYTKFGFSGYELDPQLGQAEFWEKAL